MRTNRIIICLLLLASCTTPKGLPKVEDVGRYPKGSYIIMKRANHGNYFKGELIAADSMRVFMLDEKLHTVVAIPTAEVKTYRLRYASNINYAPFLPLYVLTPFFHGFFLVFTLPVSTVAAFGIASRANSEFLFTERNLPLRNLHMYARFPQGIPEGIQLTDIR